MKYAHYDETTKGLEGYYDDSIHTTIPTPNIELSEEQWQNALDLELNCVDTETGILVYKDLRTAEEITDSEMLAANEEARAYLASTDWYVIRFIETGTKVPLDVSTKRTTARLSIV